MLISLAEERLRQPNIGRVMWLLMITLMLIYSEKEKGAKRDTEYTEEKMSTRKSNAGAMVWAKRDKEK